MDRCKAPAPVVKPVHGDADDDPDELGVFAAERYFYGDDALLWCERSSSSLSVSSAFRTAGTLEHDRSVVPTPTAATSSSEASWNSRSALLPLNEPPAAAAEKLRAVARGGAATPAAAEPEPCDADAEGISERAGRRRASSSSSSSNLRRWLLGVAGCGCVGGDGEESVSVGDTEAGDSVPGAGGKRCNDDARRLSPRTEMLAEPAFEEAPAAATVRRGSGRWLLEGGKVLVERDDALFSPIEIAGHGKCRAANSVELSMPPAVLHPAATATSDERPRRVKSFEKFRPFGDDDQGISALGSAARNSSAFTIVAGRNAPRAAAGGGEDDDDDAAAASELGCAYPPSEASVVWSVVTADGAASGNFSSAASGYYYHYFGYGEDGAPRRHDAAAARSDRRRRGGGIATTTGSLLACMSDKAVDAVGPVHRPEVELGAHGGGRNGGRTRSVEL